MRVEASSRLTSMLVSVLFVSSLFITSINISASSDRESVPTEAGRIVIGYETEEDLHGIVTEVQGMGGIVDGVNATLRSLTVLGLNDADDVRDGLSRLPGLRYVESDAKTARVLLTPNDPYYDTYQWNLKRIEANLAWDLTLGLDSVVVAVVDTGVAYNHQDLADNMWNDSNGHHGYDFVNNDDDPMDDQNKMYNSATLRCEIQDIYHGTHIAGIIGAVMNNNIGIAGVAQVRIMAVKVLDDCGEGYLSDIAQGIVYATDQGARVITLSLGGADMRVVRDAALHAWRKGTVIVGAAGNTDSPVSYPAAYPTIIAVGSTGQNNQRSTWSNYGTELEIMAPGENIYSATPAAPLYQWFSGTSQSAPQVAGTIALMLSRNPSLTNTQVRTILNQTATDLGTQGWDPNYGWGLVNAYRAVQEALTGGRYASILEVPQATGYPGDPVTITATLKMIDGRGIPGRSLDFFVDEGLIGTVATNSSGIASMPYTLPSQWGMHRLFVNFTGDAEYAPSSRTTTINVEVIAGGAVAGVVLSSRGYDRLPFAQVSFVDAQIELLSDSRGEFIITGIPAGTWRVAASLNGYDTGTVDATVASNETTLIAIVLLPEGSIPPASPGFPVTALYSIVALLAIVFVVFLLAHSITRKRTKALNGGGAAKPVPLYIAEWLLSVHGIDAGMYEIAETMFVADGRQLMLVEKNTGQVVVVRIDKFGRPVYLYQPSN